MTSPAITKFIWKGGKRKRASEPTNAPERALTTVPEVSLDSGGTAEVYPDPNSEPNRFKLRHPQAARNIAHLNKIFDGSQRNSSKVDACVSFLRWQSAAMVVDAENHCFRGKPVARSIVRVLLSSRRMLLYGVTGQPTG